MACTTTLRQSGGSIILSIPKSIAQAIAVDAGSLVELAVEGRTLLVTQARRTLADRLAVSRESPSARTCDDDTMQDGTVGRELL